MNYPDSGTESTTGKKIRFSSATRALLLGLALALPGAMALAGEPIPGVDVNLGKNPGGIPVTTPTSQDGTYKFQGLAAGSYDLSVGGKRVQTITVGDKGTIGGVLSSDGGKASISVNGQVISVPVGPAGAPINTSRSNKKHAIVKAEQPPPNDLPGAPVSTTRSNKKHAIVAVEQPPPNDLPGAPVVTSRSNKKAGMAKAEQPPPDNLPGAPVVTTRSNKERGIAKAEEPLRDVLPSSRGSVKPFEDLAVKHEQTAPGPDGGDVKPGISDQGAAGGLISYGTAPPPPKDGGSKAVESPVGFGRGNAGFGGTGPGMMGGGMAPPGPTMGGPMSPGPGPVMGGGPMGPGGAMRGAGAGRP